MVFQSIGFEEYDDFLGGEIIGHVVTVLEGRRSQNLGGDQYVKTGGDLASNLPGFGSVSLVS